MIGNFKNNNVPQKGVLKLNNKAKNRTLVNVYSDALVVYSITRLIPTYNGYCVKVRRSSDNSELDIGFVDNNIDSLTLLTFVGASSGYIVTWYNQISGGVNLTQTTAASQPLIVNAGVLSPFPSAVMDGVNDYLVEPYVNSLNFSTSDYLSYSYWIKFADISTFQVIHHYQTAAGNGGFASTISGGRLGVGFVAQSSGGRYLLMDVYDTIQANEWYQVVVTKVPGYTIPTLSVFINGIQKRLVLNNNNFLVSDDFENTEPTWIGRRQVGNLCNCSVSNFTTHGRVLSDMEIKKIYNETKKMYGY